ncbi:hypothetical protein BZG80_14710 [Salinivibrio sp. MA440]|uniref:hypothetical protein n=1 Tax=Salinivibrio sp. MA440 TaxID=1909456 RepID=UPI0009D48D10|nr:hypothetical protein [Salinivibrio sp. MA440]OOF01746.1 hypothetical protein BZG80_14710 [Salinivibrio sp. MA440]
MSVKQLGWLALALHVVATPAWAEKLTRNTAPELASEHFFIQSIPSASQGFDSWTVQSGYRYPLQNVSVYIGTQLKSETAQSTSAHGLLSGIDYHFTDKLRVSSQISHDNDNALIDQWGVSSRYQFSDAFGVNAGLDVEFDADAAPESIYQLGVGLSF